MITQPYPNFIRPDAGGNVKPISNGLVYIGQAGLDPISYPIDVFYKDNNGVEQKIDQPIRLNATGIPVASENNGAIIRPYTGPSTYSILIVDKNGKDQYTNKNATSYATSDQVEQATNQAQNELVGGSIFKGSNGETVEAGDEIPVNTTHIMITVGGADLLVKAWGSLTLPATVITLPSNDNGLAGYDIVTSQGTFEFVTLETERLRNEGNVEGWGASESSSDNYNSFVAAQAYVGAINLPQNKSYYTSLLPDVSKLIIRGDNSKIRYSQKLAERTYDLIDIEGVEFDAEFNDVTRCIRVLKNSHIKFRRVNGKNVRSSTFCYFFNISTEGSIIDIDDCFNESLHATENGVVGDLNGSCRFILVSDDDATPIVNPSSGSIKNVTGKDLQPREDGDMIHVTSASDHKFEILIENPHGIDVAKRVVKVQANGVNVKNPSAVTENITEAMYSIVSHYGEFGTVDGVSGEGWFANGCDTQYGSTFVGSVSCKNTGAAEAQSSAFKTSGGCVAKVVHGEGFEHIASAYVSLEADAVVDIGEVYGSSTGYPVFGRCAIDIESFALGKSNGTSLGAFQPVKLTRLGGTTAKFKKAETYNIDADSSTFSVVDVIYCDEFKYGNITGDNTGTVLAVNGGTVYGENAASKGGTRVALLTGVTNATLKGTRGALTEQVRTQGCDNVVVVHTETFAGIPALADEFSNPSTNSQEIQTITKV